MTAIAAVEAQIRKAQKASGVRTMEQQYNDSRPLRRGTPSPSGGGPGWGQPDPRDFNP